MDYIIQQTIYGKPEFDSLKACDSSWFIVPILCWTLFIVWGILYPNFQMVGCHTDCLFFKISGNVWNQTRASIL